MHIFPFRVIDLTHTITDECPTWDGQCGFEHVIDKNYDKQSEYQFRTHKIKMVEGIGTHLDAPAHCIPDASAISDLKVDDLISPCVVINITAQAHERFMISREEIESYENRHGIIQPKSMIIFYTGWDKFWFEPKKYHNNLEFPSVTSQAAEFLVNERDIAGLGIDTLSPDCPRNGYPVHKILLSHNRYIVENVANADKLPATGSFTMALPLKIKDGTEAPMRFVGLIPK